MRNLAEKSFQFCRTIFFLLLFFFSISSSQIVIKDTIEITPRPLGKNPSPQANSSGTPTITVSITANCPNTSPSRLYIGGCNGVELQDRIPSGTATYVINDAYAGSYGVTMMYWGWLDDGDPDVDYTINVSFSNSTVTKQFTGTLAAVWANPPVIQSCSFDTPYYTGFTFALASIEHQQVHLFGYNRSNVLASGLINGYVKCNETTTWNPENEPLSFTITAGSEYVAFYDKTTHARLGSTASVLAQDIATICLVADGKNPDSLGAHATIQVTGGNKIVSRTIEVIPVRFQFEVDPPVIKRGERATVRIATMVYYGWNARRVTSPVATVGILDAAPKGTALKYIAADSTTLQRDDTLFNIETEADYQSITGNSILCDSIGSFSGDTIAVRLFAKQTSNGMIVSRYLDPARSEFVMGDSIKGEGVVYVVNDNALDHFEVTFDKDTVAFTESSKIFVQAKDANDQDVELGADKLVKLSVTSNSEYGTFINKNDDTLKTTPVELEHVLYGDEKAGLIQFAAVKKNPTDPVLSKVQVILESDPTKEGERKIPVVEQTLKIVMEGVREVVPRNLRGLSTPPAPTNENKKEFNVQLTRNKAAVPNHPFKLTTDYIDGSGGHDHLTPRRDRNRDNYGWLILKRTGGNFDSPYNGPTQDDGRERFDFVSSFFGDRMHLRVETTQPNKKQFLWDTLSIAEKVSELQLLNDGADYDLIGGKAEHHGPPTYADNHNHFSTADVRTNIQRIATAYHQQFPNEVVLQINDMSLPYGGRFDFRGQWAGNSDHQYHRQGTDVDIRSTSIPDDDRYTDVNRNGRYDRGEPITFDLNGNGQYDYTNTAFERICRRNNVQKPKLEHPGVLNREHYHLYFILY